MSTEIKRYDVGYTVTVHGVITLEAFDRDDASYRALDQLEDVLYEAIQSTPGKSSHGIATKVMPHDEEMRL